MSDQKIDKILLLLDTPARPSKSARKKARKARRNNIAEGGDVLENFPVMNFESCSTIEEGVILEGSHLVINHHIVQNGIVFKTLVRMKIRLVTMIQLWMVLKQMLLKNLFMTP